jgi:hypothetical protein
VDKYSPSQPGLAKVSAARSNPECWSLDEVGFGGLLGMHIGWKRWIASRVNGGVVEHMKNDSGELMLFKSLEAGKVAIGSGDD